MDPEKEMTLYRETLDPSDPIPTPPNRSSNTKNKRQAHSVNLDNDPKVHHLVEMKPLSTSVSTPLIQYSLELPREGDDDDDDVTKLMTTNDDASGSSNTIKTNHEDVFLDASSEQQHHQPQQQPQQQQTSEKDKERDKEKRRKKKRQQQIQEEQEQLANEEQKQQGLAEESSFLDAKFSIEGDSASDGHSSGRTKLSGSSPSSSQQLIVSSAPVSSAPNMPYVPNTITMSRSETELNRLTGNEHLALAQAGIPRAASELPSLITSANDIVLSPSGIYTKISLNSELSQSERNSQYNKSGKSSSSNKKKSSWYNAFYPTYKSRSADFKKVFGDSIDADERLVVEYSCALQKDILIQGRLYATKNYLCFYAKIFNWETSVNVKWSDVISMTKEKTALVIPNAIQVHTEKEKYFFSSFAARDKTFQMLTKLWQTAKHGSKPCSASELWGLIHEAYGNELGLTSDDEEDYVSPPNHSDLINDISGENSSSGSYNHKAKGNKGKSSKNQDNNGPLQSSINEQDFTNSSNLDNSTFVANDMVQEIEQKQTKKRKKKGKENSYNKTNKDQDMVASEDMPDAADKKDRRRKKGESEDMDEEEEEKQEVEEEDEVTDDVEEEEDKRRRKNRKKKGYGLDLPAPKPSAVSDANSSKKADAMFQKWRSSVDDAGSKDMLTEIFNIDVDTLFTLYFTKSKFFSDFHKSRKTFDIEQGEWEALANGDKFREVSLNLALTHPVGPKSAQVTEKQTMLGQYSNPGEIYALKVDVINSGIPYADSFHVVLNFCLCRVSQNQSRMVVLASIKYKKTVWGIVKNFIEKNTWSGLEEFYQDLSRCLENESEEIGLQNGTSGPHHHKPDVTRGSVQEKKKRVIGNKNTKSFVKDSTRSREVSSNVSATGTSSNPILRFFSSEDSTSAGSGNSFTNNTIFSAIMVFLITLLCANTFLLYKMWFLESRIAKDNSRSPNPFDTLRYLDPHFLMKGDKTSQKRTTEEWLMLLQKQEMIHQMELEKWNEMIGMAADLLRKTEQSLTNLQMNIHPMTLQKLRGVMYLQQEEEILNKHKAHESDEENKNRENHEKEEL